jgi:hypothetical protein
LSRYGVKDVALLSKAVWRRSYANSNKENRFRVIDTIGGTNLETDPLRFLSLAEKYDMAEIGSIAMACVAKLDKKDINISNYSLSGPTVLQMMEVREERTLLLIQKLGQLIEDEIMQVERTLHRKHTSPSAFSTFAPQPPRPKTTQLCVECNSRLYDLLVGMAVRLHKEPSWSAFILEGDSRTNVKCSDCNLNVWGNMTKRTSAYSNDGVRVKTDFETLEEEIRRIESEAIPLKMFTPQVVSSQQANSN